MYILLNGKIMIPNNARILFKGIVGSQSYGLATENCDKEFYVSIES